MDESAIRHPATFDEFQLALARIRAQEEEFRLIRRMGAFLAFEHALEKYPFVCELTFAPSRFAPREWELKAAFEIPGGSWASGRRIVDAMWSPGDAPASALTQAAQLASSGVTRAMARDAMADLERTAERLLATFDDGARQALASQERETTARGAAQIAIEMGFPELGALIEKAKLAADNPGPAQKASARSL